MIQTANAPIHLFMEYVNEHFPSDEEVVIYVVDNELEVESNMTLIGKTDDGQLYLGRYWRQEEEPHIILVRQELNVFDTVGVLAHEYVHHLIWDDFMLDMTDEEIHKLKKFGILWDTIANGCIKYIESKSEQLGFDME